MKYEGTAITPMLTDKIPTFVNGFARGEDIDHEFAGMELDEAAVREWERWLCPLSREDFKVVDGEYFIRESARAKLLAGLAWQQDFKRRHLARGGLRWRLDQVN